MMQHAPSVSGQLTDALVADLKKSFRLTGVKTSRTGSCERYYFVLLWQGRSTWPSQYALRMVERMTAALPTWHWSERAGDAAFHAQSYREAHRLYEESHEENAKNTSVLLKLSDIFFFWRS